jgi:hypothetical protein
MKSALCLAPPRSFAGRIPERCDAVADRMGPRQCLSLWGDPLRPYAPGGVFDPLFAGLLVDAAGIRAATLGRFGSPYARYSKPAAPTAW